MLGSTIRVVEDENDGLGVQSGSGGGVSLSTERRVVEGGICQLVSMVELKFKPVVILVSCHDQLNVGWFLGIKGVAGVYFLS